MKTTLELKELRSKSFQELSKEIIELENKISGLQFRAEFKKLKNFREIRSLKKRLARIWTILGEQAMAKISKEAAKKSNNDQK